MRKVPSLSIFISLVFVLSFSIHNAEATDTTISDQASCTDLPIGGSWNSHNNVCTVSHDIAVSAGDTLTVSSGVALFMSSPTGSTLVKNGMAGQWIEFDVKSDVSAFLSGTPNDGWIIKKTNDSLDGTARFDSREAASNNPELVLVFGK